MCGVGWVGHRVTGWGTRTLLEQAGKHRSALGELRKPGPRWGDGRSLLPQERPVGSCFTPRLSPGVRGPADARSAAANAAG